MSYENIASGLNNIININLQNNIKNFDVPGQECQTLNYIKIKYENKYNELIFKYNRMISIIEFKEEFNYNIDDYFSVYT
jgi:hypothetical protein